MARQRQGRKKSLVGFKSSLGARAPPLFPGKGGGAMGGGWQEDQGQDKDWEGTVLERQEAL